MLRAFTDIAIWFLIGLTGLTVIALVLAPIVLLGTIFLRS